MYNKVIVMGIVIIALAILLVAIQFKLRVLAKKIILNSGSKALRDYHNLRKYPFDYKGLEKILIENSIDEKLISKFKKTQDMLSLIIVFLCVVQLILLG